MVMMSAREVMSGVGRLAFWRSILASGMLGVRTVVRGRISLRRLVMAASERSSAPDVETMT